MKIDFENGSSGALVVFVVGLFMLAFVYILAGAAFDDAVSIHTLTTNTSLGDTFPVSDERIGALNFYQQLWSALPFLFILIPLIVYAISVSLRKGPGDV